MQIMYESIWDIPVLQLRPEISCADCVAACCLKNTVLQLSNKEVGFMLASGTQLTQLPEEQSTVHDLERGKKMFMLLEDCANLVTNRIGQRVCSEYNRSPKACRVFEVGAYYCQVIRLNRLSIELAEIE